MTWTPQVTVAAVIEHRGRFLMVQEQVSGQSVYNQPAGHLEDDESLVAAVTRETLEETAWHIQPEAVIGLYRWRHPVRQSTYLRVTFSVTCLYHEPERRLDRDIERVLWMSVEEIRNQSASLRSPMVIRSIDDYLSGVTYPLSLLADIV